MELFKKPFASVRSIVAQAVVCMLLFATVSCEKEEEPPVFEPQTRVLYVYKTDTYGYLLFAHRGTDGSHSPPVHQGDFYAPVNLPETYQRHGLEVSVTFRQQAGARGNYPVVEVLEIEEVITTRRLYVLDCLGYYGVLLINFGNPGHFGATSTVAVNFPEEYNRRGLNVYVTFRRFFNRESRFPGNPFIVDVIEAKNVVYTSRFYVRKLGDCGYFLVEDLGDPEPRVLYPVNLQKEYQQEGLSVNVTFRKLWFDDMRCEEQHFDVIEVMQIMETQGERAETRIVGGESTHIPPLARFRLVHFDYAQQPSEVELCKPCATNNNNIHI